MTAPATLPRSRGRRPRCPRCGGWLQPERYGAQLVRRCLNCGRTPDAPGRPPTSAEAEAARRREAPLPRVSLNAGDRRHLAAMMTELGLAAPPEWAPPKRKVKAVEPAPLPAMAADGQLLLFEADVAAGDPAPARRRGPRRRGRVAQGRQLSLYLPLITGC